MDLTYGCPYKPFIDVYISLLCKVLQLIIQEETAKETTKTTMKVTKEQEGKLGKDTGGLQCEDINHMNDHDVC